VDSLDVAPSVLLDASRVFRSAANASMFASLAGPEVGTRLAPSYNEFVRRVIVGGLTKELDSVAAMLETASTIYAVTEAANVRRTSGRGD
jgi:hypothetical protein